jgi:hypothetical protein
MADEGKENVEAGVEATGGTSILAKIKDLFGEKIAKAFEGMLYDANKPHGHSQYFTFPFSSTIGHLIEVDHNKRQTQTYTKFIFENYNFKV